jgi:UDP-N-acetylmuramoyl-tripeptide--D-alanyl-D-alanine ligase
LIELDPLQIAAACGARIVAGDAQAGEPSDAPARAIVDSRQAGPGDLFFGLPGEREDGGTFAERAIEAGAWGVVVAPEHADRAAAAGGGSRVLSSPDPLAALAGLSRRWLDELGGGACRVAGITGSTGKTSTKDILTSLLRPVFGDRLHANRENFNTEIGLPLTVLEAPRETEVMVLEMAMRGMGQIRELAQIARPQVGVITNVGPVHLELVGTVERVAEAKAELIAELPRGGACVVPAGEEALRPHVRSDVRTITFGLTLDADVRAGEVERTADGLHAEVAAGEERQHFEFGFTQAHNLLNALAAIGAAHALDVPLAELAEGARTVAFSSLRGEEVELPGGVLIINDCYNANPISMRAAVDHLAEVASLRHARRAVAVLGDMRELGSSAAAFHHEVGEQAARSGVSLLVAVGEMAGAYAEGYGAAGEAHRAPDAETAAVLVRDLLEEGDVVLVKGSRGVGLELVAQLLAAPSSGEPSEQGR